MSRQYNLSEEGRKAKQKKFIFESNQKLWDQYEQIKTSEGSTIGSVRQYKPAVLALEKFTGNELLDVTSSQLHDFVNSDIIKNTGHVRGFLITCISKGFMTVNKDVIAYLIPTEYKKLVEILMV